MAIRKEVLSPLVIIAVGGTWLLNVLEILPGVDWIWTGGLAAAGVLVLVTGGWNRFTAIMGPFLLISSVFSVLRQTGRLELDLEVPLLVIILGLLWLYATVARLPLPAALAKADDERS